MHRLAVAVVFLLAAIGAIAQNPASDPQALALAQKSIAALTGGAKISDVTLTGSVEVDGSDAGSGVLKALGTEESRVDLTLPTGSRTEVRDAQTGPSRGQWASQGQNAKATSSQNCQTDAVWFFPALTSLGGRGNRRLKYVGQETHNGVAVEHIRAYSLDMKLPKTVAARLEALTAVDFYLDATTLLPVTLSFNVHPDDDNNADLIMEVQFSNYQNVNGAMVPMRIQKYLQGNLLFDFTVSNAAVNTGLGFAEFVISASQAGS